MEKQKKKRNREGEAGEAAKRDLQEFAGRLSKARERLGKTQKEVAMAIGLSSYISYQCWERARRWPSAEYLASLCRVLEVSADVLLGLITEEDQKGEVPDRLPKNP